MSTAGAEEAAKPTGWKRLKIRLNKCLDCICLTKKPADTEQAEEITVHADNTVCLCICTRPTVQGVSLQKVGVV